MGTIFLDIDGTILKYKDSLKEMLGADPVLLPGVLEKLHEWHTKGYRIVLVSARPESTRRITEQQLDSLGVIWNDMILGLST